MRAVLPTLSLLLPFAAFAGYEASSQKRDARYAENAFSIVAAIDDDPETAWQSDPEQDNIGQWLQVDVPTASVDKLELIAGWAKTDKTYQDYHRIKSATVEIFDKSPGGDLVKLGEQKIQVGDQAKPQILELDDVKITSPMGGRVKVTINETYPGVDFTNLAVSEIRVHLKEFPAETLALEEDPEAGDEAHQAPNMLDGSDRTYFVATGTSVKIQAKANGYGLASVGLQAGPATHARPKTVVLRANDAEVKHTIPEDAKGMQWLLLPTLVGYTGSAWGTVTIEVVDSWPGTKADAPLAIAQLKINASSIDDL